MLFSFYLFWPKQSSNVVPHAVTSASTHYCVTLALAKLISTRDSHPSGYDAVGLQHMGHL